MPRYPHSQGYLEDQTRRALPHTLADGPGAMREAALQGHYMWPRGMESRVAYGPDDSLNNMAGVNQGTTVYELRVRESTLKNVWLNAITRSAYAPFRKSIQVDGWSDGINRIVGVDKGLQNRDLRGVDGTGRSLHSYMMEVALWQVVDGIHLTLVDLPTVETENGEPIERSMGDDDRAGIRPFWSPIQAQHFDPLVVEVTVSGASLRQFAIYLEETSRTSHGNPANATEATVSMWRTYVLDGAEEREGFWYRDSILQEPKPDSDVDTLKSEAQTWRQVSPLGQEKVLKVPPIVPFYGDFWEGKNWRARPPYGDEADLQAASGWRKRSYKDDRGRRDARMRTHQAGVNLDEDGNPKHQLDRDYLYSESPAGSASVLETSGAALKALRDDISDDEQYLKEACRSITALRTGGPKTATEINLVGIEAASYEEAVILGNVASMTALLSLTELMAGVPPGSGSVTWPHDVIPSVSPEALADAKELLLEGKFSMEGYLEMMKKSGGTHDEFDIEKELARQKSEGLMEVSFAETGPPSPPRAGELE